jgi:hypothetical protein
LGGFKPTSWVDSSQHTNKRIQDNNDFSKEKSSLEDLKTNKKKKMDEDIILCDEDGNELKDKWGRKPGVKRQPKNQQAKELQRKFIELCKKNLGIKPAETFVGYIRVLDAIKKHELSPEKILDLFDEWFTMNKPDEELIHITRALSDNQINSYKVRNK